MNAQEIFDTVLTGLRKQGKASMADGECMYRGDSGMKCAAGMFIPDDVYEPEMEHNSVGLLIEKHPVLEYLTPYKHLLDDLQTAHDLELADHSLAAWEAEMALIAQQRGLVYA